MDTQLLSCTRSQVNDYADTQVSNRNKKINKKITVTLFFFLKEKYLAIRTVDVGNDYANTCFLRIFAKMKDFAKPFQPVLMVPRKQTKYTQKMLKISWHCSFKTKIRKRQLRIVLAMKLPRYS